MLDTSIKVGYLISYDYEYMKHSLPTVYDHADIIYLAVDKDGLTWTGEKFEIATEFFDWVKAYDTQNKIHIYKDSFYDPSISPMECDTRERNMLAKAMGEGGWHVQIDADEYFLDFEGFVKHLKSLDIAKPVTVHAEWVTIFKQDKQDFMCIDNSERFPAATNNPVYVFARMTSKPNRGKNTDFKVIHHSWGRSEEELAFKLKNWSHTLDFDAQSYFNLWKSVNRYTYKYLRNFHPMHPDTWKKLECIEADSISSLLEQVKEMQLAKKKESKSFFGIFKR